MPDLPPIDEGTVLGGDYRILRASSQRLELGSGAMGAVYLAEDIHLRRKVVIKTLKISAIRTEREHEEFSLRVGLQKIFWGKLDRQQPNDLRASEHHHVVPSGRGSRSGSCLVCDGIRGGRARPPKTSREVHSERCQRDAV